MAVAATTDQYTNLTKTTIDNAAASAAAAKKKTSLGQDQFLKLMTTQMTHQDPNNPMQNGEFLSQMAQFGTVSGIQDLQKSFASFASSINSDQALQAASLVGRDVTVTSNQGVLASGGDISGTVNLKSSTPNLQVTVVNASTGELVKTLELGNQSAGSIPFSWDGTNTAGTLSSPGTYKIAASAPIDGKNTAFTTDINSRVGSVVMANSTSGMKVNLADGSSVDFAQVKQIL
jgi:flagellar basal-body rod modification protein FlgD